MRTGNENADDVTDGGAGGGEIDRGERRYQHVGRRLHGDRSVQRRLRQEVGCHVVYLPLTTPTQQVPAGARSAVWRTVVELLL